MLQLKKIVLNFSFDRKASGYYVQQTTFLSYSALNEKDKFRNFYNHN